MADRLTIPGVAGGRWLLGFDTARCVARRFDVLVIGSGIAGLTAALYASRGRSVALMTKGRLTETNTWHAQGGIAGAVGEADSVELHLADTLVVGQGLCDEHVVRAVVAEAAEALSALRDFGVDFDLTADGTVSLAREGGHSLPRVLHSGDKTGEAIQRALSDTLCRTPGIDVFQRRFLVDLLTEDGRCCGALMLDAETGELEAVFADAVVLATGGAGQLFRVTTNPLIATGDGVAAAWRAGADVVDMEFVQFHPTALDHEAAPRFLVSEALRGEGAYLLDCDHHRFMPDVHPLAELAPRDVVSREIERVMRKCRRGNVLLDARHLGREYLSSRFPTIWHACLDAGYDLSADLVPVAPAAHYLMGGIRVDVDGHTSLPGLFASGEVAGSGLHGANRLASNSLLEGLVFSRRIARHLDSTRAPSPGQPLCANTCAVATEPLRQTPSTGEQAPEELVRELHRITGSALGMARTEERLAQAEKDLAALAERLPQPATATDLQLANMVTVASLIARSARTRTETRGSHSRLDFPERDDDAWHKRIVMNRQSQDRFVPVDRGARQCS